jgi:hypothetical protein
VNEDWVSPDDAEAWAGEFDPDVYQVLTLDPGGTTGWALFCVHPDAVTGDPEIHLFGEYGNVLYWTAGEFTGSSLRQCDEIVELANSWPGARLVTEDFKLRQLNAELSPVEINHTIAWALRPRYFVKQNASLAMTTLTDDRQKDLGFWIPGKEHARDAVKHAVTFLKRKKAQARAVTGVR